MSDTVSTILILGVVALVEGVRRLPPDAFVLRRVLFGRWTVATPLQLGRDWCLIAWPIPMALSLVLEDQSGENQLPTMRQIARIRARARRVRAAMMALRILGTVILVALVVGVPLATLRYDTYGLTVSLEVVFLFCVIQAILTHLALRRAGASPRVALFTSLKLLWPFTAPRAAEIVQEQVVRGAAGLVATAELVGRDRFLRSVRARVYDEVQRDGMNGVVGQLFRAEELREFLRQPPGSETNPFCPRCGAEYRRNVRDCANCEGVALVDSA